MTNTVITARNISLQHGTARRLLDVSVEVRTGEILALIGPNGAGKSSLLAVLSGDETPTQGVLEYPLWPSQATPLWTACHRGVLPQQSSLSFPFAAQDVVRLGRSPHASGRDCDEGIVQRAMKALDIDALRHVPYTRLSGGERQRVQLARVLAQIWQNEDDAPRVLMLDEPTASLDLAHQQELMKALRQLCEQGVAIVVVLHDLNLAAAWADRILCLQQGRGMICGTPHEVLTREHIREAFACECVVSAHPQTGQPVVLHAY